MMNKQLFKIILLVVATIGVILLLDTQVARRYFEAHKPLSDGDKMKPAGLLILGDIMLDRSIRQRGVDKGYLDIFACVKDILLAQSAVLANLEGPITDYKSTSLGSKPGAPDNYQFTFDPAVTDALLLSNIGTVSIGNNHILNFGSDGLAQTKKYLERAGIKYFGDSYYDNDDTKRSVDIVMPDRVVTAVNYNKFCCTPTDSQDLQKQNVIELVVSAKEEGKYVLVYTHWGTEYATTSNRVQRELAHAFIDAGADLVIGSHPHVVQEREEYRGRVIYYSLGNFVFDQWFSDDVKKGLGVRLEFKPGESKPEIVEIPLVLSKQYIVCPAII